MMIDSRTLPEGTTIDADLCIVGAGAAGITIALEMIGKGLKIALVEAGGFDYDDATQALYEGEMAGNPAAPLDISRLRYFGGTTNHWAGYCRPFDDSDFETRSWVPDSGWPFSRETLLPFYRRAQAYVGLGAFAYQPDEWADHMAEIYKIAPMHERLRPAIFQQSPPTNFGTAYREKLAEADGVSVYLWGNLVDIETTPNGGLVTDLRFKCLDGPAFSIRPGQAVLAMGGIENARMLLLSDRVQPRGLGNAHDLVGRYFMDHPAYEAATIHLDSPTSIARAPAKQSVATLCMLNPEVEQREGLLRFLTTLEPLFSLDGTAPGYVALRRISRSLRAGQLPNQFLDQIREVAVDLDGAAVDLYRRMFGTAEALRLRIHPEASPNPQSRLTRIAERDALGLNRIKLDWRLNDLDRRTIRRGLEIVGEEFGKIGLGRLKFDDWVLDEQFEVPGNGSYHHIGTTRMHDDPRRGVVDRHGRLHGTGNLYIAGSSVFPTESHSNPTLTIVALALRLSDHLAGQPA